MAQGIRKIEDAKLRVGSTIRNIFIYEWIGSNKHRQTMYKCICGICKNDYISTWNKIRGSKSASCGCIGYDQISLKQKKHGCNTRREKPTREYRSWASMKQRCNNLNNKDYKYYGGKGVKVCERWNNFENFLLDMGKIPDGDFTIDRIDSSGNYELLNCRWITRQENARLSCNEMWSKRK